MKLDLDKMNIEELRAAQVAIGDIIEAKQREALAEMKRHFEREAAKIGLTLEDLSVRKHKSRKKGKNGAVYVNPRNPSQTWAGMGRPPAWMDMKNKERFIA